MAGSKITPVQQAFIDLLDARTNLSIMAGIAEAAGEKEIIISTSEMISLAKKIERAHAVLQGAILNARRCLHTGS
jgi:hypothetical protein